MLAYTRHPHVPLGSPTHRPWPAYGRRFVLACYVTCVCIPLRYNSSLEVQYITSNYRATATITQTTPSIRQKQTRLGTIIVKCNVVNKCYDNTPLKQPNTKPLLGVALNTTPLLGLLLTPHPCWGLLLTPHPCWGLLLTPHPCWGLLLTPHPCWGLLLTRANTHKCQQNTLLCCHNTPWAVTPLKPNTP